MTLADMKKATYSLIEELTDDTEFTADEDLASKFNEVCSHIMFELTNIKRILKTKIVSFEEGVSYDLKDIDDTYNFYQIKKLDLKYDIVDTILIPEETKETIVYYYVFPEKITILTPDTYEFDLSDDLLEIMPYGIASDLLLADISSSAYATYATRYQNLKDQLDTRYDSGSMLIEDIDMGEI